MTTHILKGSKQEIVDHLVRISGEVREAIVFVDDPAPNGTGTAGCDIADIFAEMHAYMVDVPDVDDSREAIYSRAQGE